MAACGARARERERIKEEMGVSLPMYVFSGWLLRYRAPHREPPERWRQRPHVARAKRRSEGRWIGRSKYIKFRRNWRAPSVASGSSDSGGPHYRFYGSQEGWEECMGGGGGGGANPVKLGKSAHSWEQSEEVHMSPQYQTSTSGLVDHVQKTVRATYVIMIGGDNHGQIIGS